MSSFLGSVRFVITLAALLIVAGCAQTGDFGRARQMSPLGISPPVSRQESGARSLVVTSEEIEMRNRIETFASFENSRPPTLGVLDNPRARSGRDLAPEDYYNRLRGQKSATPAGLYGKILNDIQIDLERIPPLFAAICAVKEIDRRRGVAITGISRPDARSGQAQEARRLQNQRLTSRFVQALALRHDSYAFALEQLLVDAPYEQARRVDGKISELAARLEAARASRYCRS